MYEKIIRGEELSNYFKALNDEFNELKNPRLTDLSLLNRIKQLIEDNMTADDSKLKAQYYFIPIAVMLYSPRCYIGQSMNKGLRNAVAKTLGLTTPTSVSSTFATARIWLKHNKKFRRVEERLYHAVVEGLSVF